MRTWFALFFACAPAWAADGRSASFDALQGLSPDAPAPAAAPVSARPVGVSAQAAQRHPACFARASTALKPPVWHTALLVFKAIDAKYTDRNGNKLHACGAGDEGGIEAAERAYRAFGPLAERLSGGVIKVETEVVEIAKTEPLRRIDFLQGETEAKDDYYVSPDAIVEPVMKHLTGAHDSLFVLWPKGGGTCMDVNVVTLGRGTFLDSSPQRTYATLVQSPPEVWTTPTVGEPFLHEWLHGVSRFFAPYGFTMPAGDADGGSSHGYSSGSQGWVPYYSDLMTANVAEGSAKTGIPREAWLCGTPTDPPPPSP